MHATAVDAERPGGCVWHHRPVLRRRRDDGRRTLLGTTVLVGVAAIALAACSGSPAASHGSTDRSPTGVHGTTTTTASAPARGASTTLPGTQAASCDPCTSQGTADPSLHVTQRVSGMCVGPGVAGTSSYRCFAQPSGEIFDPCFAPSRATAGPLLCVPAPNVHEVVAFDIGALQPVQTTSRAFTSVRVVRTWT